MDVKAKYFYWRPELQRLGNVARDRQTISRGLEVILHTRRHWRSFCRAHGGPAHPPSDRDKIKIIPFLVRMLSLWRLQKLQKGPLKNFFFKSAFQGFRVIVGSNTS